MDRSPYPVCSTRRAQAQAWAQQGTMKGGAHVVHRPLVALHCPALGRTSILRQVRGRQLTWIFGSPATPKKLLDTMFSAFLPFTVIMTPGALRATMQPEQASSVEA